MLGQVYPLLGGLLARRRTKPFAETTDLVVKVAASAQPSYRDIPAVVLGTGFIAIGVAAYLQTRDMSAMGSVFPRALSVAMILLSIVLVAFQIGRPAAPRSADDPGTDEPSTPRRLAIIVAMVLWVMLLPTIGFFVASVSAFLVLTAIASFERPTPRAMAVYALTAVLIVGFFYAVMAHVLLLRMPDGLLF